MHARMTVAAVLAFATGVIQPAAGAEFTTELDKFSYAVGFQVGQSLRRDGIEVNPDALSAAIRDALKGGEPQVTPDEMRAAVQAFEQRRRAQMAELIEKNAAAGRAYREENKKKKGVTETASGLQYRVVEKGSGERKPTVNDTVVVHYKGALIDGNVFDSSYDRGQPATLPVSGMVAGWQEALVLMNAGAKWQVVIPPELGYGPRGAPPRIGPNATLVFDVELIEIK